MAATNLSSMITQTVGNSTAGVNLITAPNDSSIWTAATITKSTTTTTAELPLGPAIGTATKFSLSASPGSAFCDFDCPLALLGVKLGLGWFAKASSTLTATITLTLKCYASSGNRTSDTSSTTITLQASNPAALASQFYTTFDAHGTNQFYRLTIAFTGQASVFYSIAQLQVGPGVMVQGAAIGDWQSYTPTLGASVTASVNTARWRRVGSSMEVIGAVTANNTGAAATFSIALPSGYTIDTTALPRGATALQEIGKGRFYNAATSDTLDPYNVSSTAIAFTRRGTNNSDLNGNGIISGYTVDYRFTVPISEFAGSTLNLGAGAQEEYVSSTTGTWDVAATAGNTVYGPAGSAITGSLGAQRLKICRLQSPLQATDRLQIQFQLPSSGGWIDQEVSSWPNVSWPAVSFSAFISSATIGSTDVTVAFNRYAYPGTGYNTSPGTDYSALAYTAWRLVRYKSSAPVGFGKSNSNEFGLVAPRKGQVTMTVTGTFTGWATTNAVGIYYQDQDGNHRLKFNIRGTITSATLGGGGTLTVTGVTFAFEQAVAAFNSGTNPISYAFVQASGGTIGVGSSSSATCDRIGVSGDVQLSSKPTWA